MLIKNSPTHRTNDDSTLSVTSVEAIKDSLVNAAIITFAVISLPALISSISRSARFGWQNLMFLHIFAFVVIVATAFLRHRLSYNLRTSILLGTLFANGIAGLISWGLIGAGSLTLMSCSILAALFYSKRFGWGVIAASTLFVIIIAIGVQNEWISFTIDFNEYAYASASWVLLIMGLLVFSIMVAASVGYMSESLLNIASALRARTEELERVNALHEEEISERKHSEEALRESEEKFRIISEQSLMGIAILQDNQVKYANQGLNSLIGYSVEEILNWGPGDFVSIIHPDDRAFAVEQAQKKQEGDKDVVTNYLVRVLKKDGEMIWIDQYSKTIMFEGKSADMATLIDITDRVQAEEALRDSEERHRTLFETMTQGVIYQAVDGGIASANPTAERILGLSIDQMYGKTPMDLQWKCIHEDGSNFPGETHPSMEALRTGKEVRNTVMGIFNPSIEGYVWININAVPHFKPGEDAPYQVYTTLADITERKHNEEALIKAEEDLRMTLLSIGDGVIVTDKEGSITRINPVAEGLSGWTYEEAQGQPFSEVFHIISARTRERLENPVGKVLDDGKTIGLANHTVLVAKDGTEHQIADSAAPITDPKGEIIGVVIVFRDVTEEYQLREELKKHSEQLEELVEERTRELKNTQEQLIRKEKLAVLGQLAGGVGHELRNPLGVISNSIYYLQMVMTDPDETTGEYLGMISDEVVNAEKIVSGLLDFARVTPVEREEFDLADLVSHVLEKHPLPENVEMSTTTSQDLPQVFADRLQIEQIAANLISNACQAMSDGGKLTIEMAPPEAPEGGMISLAVTDTGTGISEENMEKLFEPLFTTKTRGIGLGLAITKNLIKANGGGIEVESEEGRGSTFRVLLPTKERS